MEPDNINKAHNIDEEAGLATLRVRKRELTRLFNKGSCRSIDILKADFGHWPPRDLEIEEPQQTRLRIKSKFNMLALLGAHKRAVTHFLDHNERAKILKTRIPRWRIWLLEMEIAFKNTVNTMRRHDTIGFVIPNNTRREIFMVDGRVNEDLHDTLAHEHIHILQGDRFMAGQPSAFDEQNVREVFGTVGDIDADRKKTLEYHAKECEIQARLHLLFVQIYHFTRHMPRDLTEFKLQMIACSIIPPQDMDFQALRQGFLTAEEKDRMPLFPVLDDEIAGPLLDTSRTLRKLRRDYVPPDKRARFDNYVLPAIYADLVGLYGDRKLAARLRAELPAP